MTDGRDDGDASDWLEAQFEEPADDAKPDGASADGAPANAEAADAGRDRRAGWAGPGIAAGHDDGTRPAPPGVAPGASDSAGSASEPGGASGRTAGGVPGGVAAPVAAAGVPGVAAPAAGGFRWGLRSGNDESVTTKPVAGLTGEASADDGGGSAGEAGSASGTRPAAGLGPAAGTGSAGRMESAVAEPPPAVPVGSPAPSTGLGPSAAAFDDQTRVFDREPAREPVTETFAAASGREPGLGDRPAPLDELFGTDRFRDHAPVPAERFPVEPTVPAQAGETPRAAGPGVPGNQRILLWIVGILLAALAIVALFLVGTKLPGLLGPAPAVLPAHSSSPSPSPSASSSPTPAAAVTGPVAPGEYMWDELLGGECINPYTSPWAERFTVVDCTTGHAAQLVHRGVFGPDGGGTASYPGVDALQARINVLCTAPTVIDYAAAGAYNDIQFAAAYPATQNQWADGNHDYYCFVTRSSGAPLTASIAVPPAAPAG